MTANNYAKALSNLENENNFFVIVGAMDGVAHDELFPFAFKNKHWSGVLIEPIQRYFDKLKVNYENRNNLIFKNVAITDKQETKDIYTIPQEYIESNTLPAWCDGISTFNPAKSAISYDGIKEKVSTELVICCPFKDIVNEHKIKTIDILQIDAEGHDLIVFNQIWQLGFRPKIIYIEIVHLEQNDKNYLSNLLENNGYEVSYQADNLLAVKNEPIVTFFPKRKRVAFYTQTRWAFGSIHSVLCKELCKYDIDADIINWSIGYSLDEWKQFNKIYDVFVTTPGNPSSVLADFAGIPYEKIIAIAHAKVDLVDGITYKNNFDKFLNFVCITPYLKDLAKELGITRRPNLVRNGISFDRFYHPIAKNLNTMGYAGAIKFHFEDCKRSHLAQEITQAVNMPLNIAGERDYILMPSYYPEVDSIIVTSNQAEACGLPLMEAAAAGRLPISARVGITRDFANPPGLILPLEDKAFVETAIEKILELQKDSVKFRRLCSEAQDFARENYDWKHVISTWVNALK